MDICKSNQGIVIACSLAENDAFHMKEKVFSRI